jgi:hypothetical protein
MGSAISFFHDGTPVHISGPGVKQCSCCAVIAEYLCDWPMGRGKTCDAPLCENHAIVQGRRPAMQLTLFGRDEIVTDQGDNLHFCPTHELMAASSATAAAERGDSRRV